MSSKFQAPKGVSEYFPDRSQAFDFVRETLIASAKRSGYSLMELPVFEDTELFSRGVGESTDVVSKEMYTFEDRGGRSITLRPEGTAGVMRSVIENNLDRGQPPVKVFYVGPFFRAALVGALILSCGLTFMICSLDTPSVRSQVPSLRNRTL